MTFSVEILWKRTFETNLGLCCTIIATQLVLPKALTKLLTLFLTNPVAECPVQNLFPTHMALAIRCPGKGGLES